MSAVAARLTFSLRSSVESLQRQNLDRLERLAALLGYQTIVSNQYPGWAYAPHSRVRELLSACYKAQTGREMRCEALHAGLECGLFCGKLPGLDAIAIGPELHHVHTPDERLDLASCQRVYALLVALLEKLGGEADGV